MSQPIRDLHVEHCTKADPAYGAGLAKALKAISPLDTTPVRSEAAVAK